MQTHRQTHTHRTDYLIWTTKYVGGNSAVLA